MIKRERAVLYTRVSTDKEEQKQSIDNQREIYTEYCNANNIELKEIYHDTKSGTNARRKGFKQMMFDAGLDYKADNENVDQFVISDREPEFELIIVKDTTRFSRNAEIAESVVKRLQDKNVDILFENVNLRASDENFALIGNFLFKMGENESAMLGKKIRQTKQFKAKVKKQYKPARLPYGYTWDEDRNIIKVPEQAEVVDYIFKNYSEKGGMLLTKELNAMNKPTQRGHKWSSDKVTRIIKNRLYTGTAVVNRTRKKNVTDTKRIANNENEFIEIPNAVPSIISEEQYEEANKVRETRINKGNNKRGRKVTYTDVYFQRIICGVCGKGFKKHTTSGSGKNKKINYMCNSRIKQARCGCRGISLNNLNKGLAEVEIGSLANTMKEHGQYKDLMDNLKNELLSLEESKGRIQEQIDQLEETCDSLLDSIQEYKQKGNKKLVDGFEKKYNKVYHEKEGLEFQLESMNVEKIQRLLNKVEEKKILLNELRLVKVFTNEEKLKLLKKVVVSDYQLEYYFSMPNYDDEILEFNNIFKGNPIDNNIPDNPFGVTVRRNHKEAREVWEQLEEDRAEQDYLQQNGLI